MMLMEARNISFGYAARQPILHEVSLTVRRGVNLGIVGESGSGKTTLLRLLLGLERPESGTILAQGKPLQITDRQFMQSFRRFVQPVFQDPYSSLDPRQRIDRIIAEPLRALKIDGDRAQAVQAALASVGLAPDSAARYPHAFSGGQRQRIAIARAIAARPQVLLADEPVSALDLSTRVVIVDLLRQLARDLTLVLVSHDLGVVAALCDEMIVLQHGRIVEAGPTRQILDAPNHPYTAKLLASVPRMPA
ncbi:MAG: ATP-binding cassette domain-containing protein [Paracoccaceae bacterium]|nr:ATP-binding cassette domain-containing protein [Paracoccaceae bacterium]